GDFTRAGQPRKTAPHSTTGASLHRPTPQCGDFTRAGQPRKTAPHPATSADLRHPTAQRSAACAATSHPAIQPRRVS
ncbi:hypothetical protein AB0M83_47360, partial [Amycolatopsis sp. NPDC051106]|uniref:hypothetical protein n=1 Tax=Amycolatopsis sp. NPDC051106 TaxID=3157100 RepID=UPI003439F5AF